MKRSSRDTLLARVAAAELLCLVVLALWPAPHKYPWGVPLAALGTFVLSALRSRGGDSFGAFLLGFATIGGLASWTLASWLHLDDEGALLVWVAVLAIPVGWLFTLVRRGGGLTSSPDAVCSPARSFKSDRVI